MPPAAHQDAVQLRRKREITLIKICMAVTGLLMLAQIVIGYSFNVMALVAESYHMMNDVAAFVVQLYADELGNFERTHSSETTAFSFGFGRVEFLANLVQGILLLALCLTLALESIQRAYSPETILFPPLVVGIGVLTLVWNITMFNLFEGAHHAHDEHALAKFGRRAAHPLRYRHRVVQAASSSPSALAFVARSSPRAQAWSERSLGVSHSHAHEHESPRERTKKKGMDFFHHPENSLAIHAFGDALGTIAIILDGLASWLFGPKNDKISGVVKPWSGTPFVDPICALVAVYIILSHSFPLVTSSSYALMHAFDPVESERIRSTLRGRSWLPRQVAVRATVKLLDLHIWQLTATSTFATVKLGFAPHDAAVEPDASDLVLINEAAKRVLAPLVPAVNATVEVTVGASRTSSPLGRTSSSRHQAHDDLHHPPSTDRQETHTHGHAAHC